jgi:uncharacterized protein (TIGR01777 family)
MKVLVTGSSGLIGSALIPYLVVGGHHVVRLLRPHSPSSTTGVSVIRWDPMEGKIESSGLEDLDAVVHLAGESIAAGRWTAERKARIRDSRIKGTELLCGTLARLARPPKVLVSASAIGYYGDRGAETLREESPPGSGFLADVSRDWESATAAAVRKGLRVCLPRFGVVLSPAGGALAKMLPPFRMGAGGKLGSGRQYMSWVALDDALGAIHQMLNDGELRGPVNVVAPNPVTNFEFTKTLGRVLCRPTFASVPAFATRLAFGEMADALLLSSTRVQPAKLQGTGYRFRHPELEGALRHLLGKNKVRQASR